MYFWNVNRLVAQMRQGPIPQDHALRYLLASSVLLAAGSGVPGLWNARAEPALLMEWIGFWIGLALVVPGTILSYRANGGSAGSDFAARFLALSWVLGIRVLVMGLLPMILAIMVLMGVIAARGKVSPNSVDALSLNLAIIWCLMLEAVFYWRLSYHCRRAASPANPAF